jgi:hypothetical protein
MAAVLVGMYLVLCVVIMPSDCFRLVSAKILVTTIGYQAKVMSIAFCLCLVV